MVEDLLANENICVCVATGGWRDPALVKLEAAGIYIEDTPLASSDDSHERLSIMRRAHDLTRASSEALAFGRVVYVADHIGDFLNAKKLGYDFVGIGSGVHGEQLKRAGATHVQPNFLERDYFHRVFSA